MRTIVTFVFLLCAWSVNAAELDIVFANARVMDPESGLDAIRHVGIRGSQIAAISIEPLRGNTVIDAKGLVVAPGFIDLHSHGQTDENYRYKAMDGVATALELEVGVSPVAHWYAEREDKALVNFGATAGHIPACMAVMHDTGTFLPRDNAVRLRATADEVRQITELIQRGLDEGGLGIGYGINYVPQTTRVEILDLFRLAAERKIANFVHTTEAYPYTATHTRIDSAIYDDGWQERLGITYKDLQWVATGERLTAETFARYRKEGGGVIAHSIPEEISRLAVANPEVIVASDGVLTNGKGHPRSAGTFARVLGYYVREQKALGLMDAIRKMTLLPAQRLEKAVPQMQGKGRIKVGADADLTVFDPARVIDHATFENPAQYSSGISYVMVNGVLVVRDGKIVEGVKPGIAIRRSSEE